MTPPRFNLIDDPWLIVRNVNGDTETVSMHTAFARAHELRRLSGELPSQDFAVLRILLAVLYRAVEGSARADPLAYWAELWATAELPLQAIDQYLEEWHDHFYLFDKTRPWFQVPDLAATNGETKPVDLLIPDCPIAGGLFSMRRGYSSISPAEAARWLIHCQAYDISGIKSGAVGDDRVKGGKGYPIGNGWAGWLGGITVTGSSLRETLLLNFVANSYQDDDLPVWELPQLTSSARRGAQGTGPVSLFSWPQRRIRLFTNDQGNVSSVLVCNGDPIDYQFQHAHEVMTGWRHSVPQSKKFNTDVFMPRQFDPTEKLWRGLDALLPVLQQDPQFLPARVLEWSADLAGNRVLPDDHLTEIETVGVTYGAQSASWDEIFSDKLAFNVRLAASHSFPAKEIVFSAVARAVEAINALGSLAGNLQVAAGGDYDSAAAAARGSGFAETDSDFRAWLATFDPEGDLEGQLQQFTDAARDRILRLAEGYLREAGPTAWVGRKVTRNRQEHVINTGQADSWFRRSLARALPYAASEEGVSA
ncbi:type I-E CRISPR-associated protein Cse1/CasA [Brooklawnia propionicigenes]|uniref:Type I-E CRISPR-associated protein Cse1/CasA n=1 Tax=Brooklawnia propionicigenes TaxID=3041175 RepID=A0AAN0MFH3_9ACTN|nr:type I-E CRISPR-associated protein Cse1/CasA [Brooklawnia sp. SH051]BEH01374.1 type I-E CRISPR-associated protein Cse1/CasA [Brooklawnia sp. SH051]